eukprot:TRINITY_DN45481_c0_g1_i1.p1 TRINITY_DN45481_c0_g1~~TRINITY_DN45481_c0_g1_i1.p1  ORF type:complete len:833 (-),score=131.33 TRINITY_DN45481_c0_g1_i1:57-2528(-)
MPALVFCHRTLLVAADDLWMVFWMFVPLQLLWAMVGLGEAQDWWSDGRSPKVIAPRSVLLADAGLCLAVVPLDLLVIVASAYGRILRPRRFEGLLRCSLALRVILLASGAVSFFVMIGLTTWHHGSALFYSHIKTARLGQGRFQVPEPNWVFMLLWFGLLIRPVVYVLLVLFWIQMFMPKKLKGAAFSRFIFVLLRLLGTTAPQYETIVKLISGDLLGHLDPKAVTPTDLLFGFLLVAARQRQGLLGCDPDDESMLPLRDVEAAWEEEAGLINDADEESESTSESADASSCHLRSLPPSLARAASVTGVLRPLTKLRATSREDQTAIEELLHLAPFASGTYGPAIFGLLTKSFHPGTMLPTRLVSAVCGALPCLQTLPVSASAGERLQRRCCCLSCFVGCCVPGTSPKTVDDWPWGANEDFLRDSVEEQARRAGTIAPELVWATWRNSGPERCLPMAVFADHEYDQVVVTIRGTADLKDIVNDIGITPVFFDPLGLSTSSCRREPPFDDQRDFFVPKTWLSIAKDALRELEHSKALEKAVRCLAAGRSKMPSRHADTEKDGAYQSNLAGVRLLLTGHSLGAGVACLLALELTARFPEALVRYVGFEPPGCVLSPRLSEECQRLGWYAMVCAHDWVPRLSGRAAQRLCDHALDELEACNRSKWQLVLLLISGAVKRYGHLLCCMRRPVSAYFTWLAGGPLPQAGEAGAYGYGRLPTNVSPAVRSGNTFPEMLPPGNILYLRPVACEPLCAGYKRTAEWAAEWADPVDMQQEFIVASDAFKLHVPWVYEYALNCVSRRLHLHPQRPRAAPFQALALGRAIPPQSA